MSDCQSCNYRIELNNDIDWDYCKVINKEMTPYTRFLSDNKPEWCPLREINTNVPFVSFSNEELEDKPAIKEDYVICDKCGEKHNIEYEGKKDLNIGFFKCKNDLFVATINGKRIF